MSKCRICKKEIDYDNKDESLCIDHYVGLVEKIQASALSDYLFSNVDNPVNDKILYYIASKYFKKELKLLEQSTDKNI